MTSEKPVRILFCIKKPLIQFTFVLRKARIDRVVARNRGVLKGISFKAKYAYNALLLLK